MSTDIEVRDGAMSTQMRSLLASGFGQVRYEPTAKRIRAILGGTTVVDSARVMLVWEPRRVVPSYAVPVDDVRGTHSIASTFSPALDKSAWNWTVSSWPRASGRHYCSRRCCRPA